MGTRPARTWIVALLALMGIAGVCDAFFQLDCYTTVSAACRRAADAGDLSWHHYAHEWIAFLTQPVPILISLLVPLTEVPNVLALPKVLGFLPFYVAGLFMTHEAFERLAHTRGALRRPYLHLPHLPRQRVRPDTAVPTRDEDSPTGSPS